MQGKLNCTSQIFIWTHWKEQKHQLTIQFRKRLGWEVLHRKVEGEGHNKKDKTERARRKGQKKGRTGRKGQKGQDEKGRTRTIEKGQYKGQDKKDRIRRTG